MIYRFIVLSQEEESFQATLEIGADDTFLSLRNFLLSSLSYPQDLFSTFFVCDEEWNRDIEIPLEEMETSSDEDSYVMDSTTLESLVDEDRKEIEFVFDTMQDRSLFVRFLGFSSGTISSPRMIDLQGTTPTPPTMDSDFSFSGDDTTEIMDLDDDLFGESIDDFDELLSQGLNDDIEY